MTRAEMVGAGFSRTQRFSLDSCGDRQRASQKKCPRSSHGQQPYGKNCDLSQSSTAVAAHYK